MAKHGQFKTQKSKSTKRFEVKEAERIDYDINKPIFSFYYMRYGQEACLSQCEIPDKTSVTDKLMILSQLTWQQIASISRKTNGYEIIPQDKFKVPLPRPPITPEVNVTVFRYSEGGRIAGYRNKDIYHILLVGKDLYNH